MLRGWARHRHPVATPPLNVRATLVGAALLAAGCTGIASSTATSDLVAAGAGGRPDVGVVVRVVDGDTADVRLGDGVETVRFLGIDTPEAPGGPRDTECYGAEASARTGELLPVGTLVRLERDAEARDVYDRLLAYVHRLDDDVFINLQLVEEGVADTLSIEPNTTHAATFAAAARRAEADGRGLWGACGSADVVIG